jgi:hypothetical protein
MISYWGIDHGDEISKADPFETKTRPSQRKHSMNRQAVNNSRGENARNAGVAGAIGGGVGSSWGVHRGIKRVGAPYKVRNFKGFVGTMAAAGAAGGASAGALTLNKNSKGKRATKIRSKIDSRWEKKHGGS